MADNVVHISEQSRERYHECLLAINNARAWSQGADIDVDGAVTYEAAQEMVRERENHVVEMERSFLANVARLFFTPASDGMLTVHTDFAPLSFFWRYESGYHGGLIYHASYAREGNERLPVGTWSVHT